MSCAHVKIVTPPELRKLVEAAADDFDTLCPEMHGAKGGPAIIAKMAEKAEAVLRVKAAKRRVKVDEDFLRECALAILALGAALAWSRAVVRRRH